MESQEELLTERPKEKKTLNLEKDSIQYNSQDLDQEQKVDMKPFQLNTQNIHIHVGNERTDYSGKISGITCREASGEILKDVEIYLYFGSESRHPVLETKSDNNGYFIIGDLPPGYYIIRARSGDTHKGLSHYIKVMPCGSAYETVTLYEI